jgi:hypothetical protein
MALLDIGPQLDNVGIGGHAERWLPYPKRVRYGALVVDECSVQVQQDAA